MLFYYTKSIEYNIPTSGRQPFLIWLKIYAELTGDSKKQRIKSLCDNKKMYLEYGTRFMASQPFMAPAYRLQKKKFKSDLERLMK